MRLRLLLPLLVFAFTVLCAEAGLNYVIAKTYDIYGNSETKTMTKEEYDSLYKRFSMERLLFSSAHRAAETKWKRENTLRYKGREVGQRKIKKLGTFMSMENAEKKMAKYAAQSNKKGNNSCCGCGKKNSGGGTGGNNNNGGIVLREPVDKWEYPTKLPEAFDASRHHGNNDNQNRRNHNQNSGGHSGKSDGRKLFVLQQNWINRAHSINLYIEAMNELVAEKSPDLGNDLVLIEDIPEMPKDPSENEDKQAKKEGKKLGEGIKSITDKPVSILGKKITMD